MLTYGLKKGTEREMLNIDSVANGLKCGCVCPHCGEDLEACQGDIRQHFFRHASGTECKGARMTALHIMAQNILKREKKVMLPEYNGKYYQQKATCVTLEDVDLEKDYRREDLIVRPDCVGFRNGKDDLFIEILVTHEVDDIKQAKIKQLGYPCIEIDLSDLLSINYTEQNVYSQLFDKIDNRIWINSPDFDKIEEQRKIEEEKRIEERKKVEKKKEADKNAFIEKMKELVAEWYINKRQDYAENIILQLKTTPYIKSKSLFNIFAPNDNLIEYIEKAPRNEGGLQVFYTLLQMYFDDVPYTISYQKVKSYLYDYIYSYSTITPEETIFLEELVSLRILYILLLPTDERTQRERNVYESCAKKYVNDVEIRKQVLLVASVLVRHIIGSKVISFEELTDEIIRVYPSLTKLYLKALSGQPANEYLLKNCKRAENFVANNDFEPNSIVKTIISDCFSLMTQVINEKKVKPRKDELFGFNKELAGKNEGDLWRKLNDDFQKQNNK